VVWHAQVVTHFLHLEELLDDAVGQEVELQLERGGQGVSEVSRSEWVRVHARAKR